MWFRRSARRASDDSLAPRRVVHSRAGRPVFETLEKKEMLSADAPQVLDIVADNRGFVQIVVDSDLNAATVNQSSVRFFDAGDDGLLGTADDGAIMNVDISYTFGDRTITADARLVAGTAYGVILDGSLIRGTNGCFLDGEFNGSGVASGDGAEGGDTLFYARSTGATIARITTNFGIIDIELFPGDTPITVANFLRYANERLYDRTIFHRTVEDFVIQGGGFEADLPFLPIPTFDPILNEPGISNLRGTIALAKVGGNPNSGTNQFFFNLGDNSGNLDSQNGGFTVFGEVLNEESLAVIDAIAALERFDASNVNGAFNEIPVEDLDLINNTSGVLMERDVVRIDRVAQLLVVSAEPFGQIATDEVRVITGGGSARVTLFSLSGAPLGNLDSFVRVTFGTGGNRVNSITFTSAPPEPIGLQITGATEVGSIVERRSGGGLAFIVSNVPVQDIMLKSAITGFALNGVLLADSVLLPEDIDGDNRFDDNTSIFVSQGTTRRLQLDSGLSGDVILPGGLIDLRVKGNTSMADIRIGANFGDQQLTARFDSVRDTLLDSESAIGSLRADRFSPFLTQTARIVAPSVDSLRIKNDFGADLRTTDVTASHGSIIIGGDVLRSEWSIAGALDRVRFDGASLWMLDVNGDLFTLRGGEVRNLTLTIGGDSRNFRVDSIDGAEISMASAVKFNVAKGDLIGDVTIGNQSPIGLRSFKVKGDLLDSNLSIASDASSFKVQGDIRDSSVNGASFGSLRFKEVADTTFVASGDVRQLRVTSWEGGSYQASSTRAIRTTGDRRSENAGDFVANITVSNAAVVRIAGDIRDADVRLGDNRDFRVGGDVIDSQVRFFRLFFFATIAAVDVNIEGSIIGSEIYVGDDLNSIRTDAMLDSAIYIGSTGTLTGFASAGQINPNAVIGQVLIRGEGALEFGFENSFIVGGEIGFVRLVNPQFANNAAFGIAGHSIGRVDIISDDLVTAVISPSQGVVVMDDLQVRPQFQLPG